MSEMSTLALQLEGIAERVASSPRWTTAAAGTIRRAARIIKALDEGHVPRADDDVAAWLKRMRDAVPLDDPTGQPRRAELDGLLDRYRGCAAGGLSLRPEDDEAGYP